MGPELIGGQESEEGRVEPGGWKTRRLSSR